MLLSRQLLTLCSELCQTAADAEACVARFDYVVDLAVRSSLVRVGELLCVLVFLLCEECLNVFASLLLSLSFLAAEDCNGTACTHNRNL